MEPRIADLHIHSRYSHDSLLSPRRILRRARRAGLTCVGITDHGTLLGAWEAEHWAKAEGVEVITGVELATDAGDIMGLFINEEIRATAWEDAITAIREQASRSCRTPIVPTGWSRR
jgi:predicted metal-dependent phosphoesterase TrpH